MSRQPRAYRLDDPNVTAGAVQVTDEPFDAIEAADGIVVPMGEKRRAPWLGILLSALSGLLLLGLGLAVENLIIDLYAIAPWLGWVALGLAVLAALAFLAIIGREVAGIWREQKIESLREAAIDALAVKDHRAAKGIVSDLLSLYGGRASAAQGSARLRGLTEEIIDADDRLAIAERELLAPLDLQAKRAIAGAAKQVSLVTAVSPRAIVDVAFVIFVAVRLLRTLARIYGGRPGLFGFLRLAKAAFNHLAVTGGMAVGDSLMQQVLGLGLAARISAKLGEGVLNGLMTARFGLAALSVCRPLPFIREETPKIGDVAGELISRAEAAAS
ncbi:MAG: YcjF family protein [Microvirga sp.]|jgi:putative membrane protein|uniref:TIGR01620 family protein n=1 Tax=Microvirga tunisiensis TaxID=2108360 RepID=A0A5N7ML72_9HYPH|nr:TIGR01620 family protein [Microvirga tunisiensis]MPR09207.1 TIGR01620 family protein [Microvirga tunisiensis]MPR27400.1 TIGR01620 family protein [Microvirga tunisiensis]